MPKPKRHKLTKRGRSSASRVTFSKLTLHKLDWLEWITMGLAGWFLFYPHPYEILLGILLGIPVFGMVVNGWHKPSMVTLVEIGVDKDGDDKYDVADFIDVPAWVILVRTLLDFEFDDVYSMIVPGTVACIIILVILFLTHRLIEKSSKSKWWIYSSLVFNICLYSYAGTYAANCAYDASEPEVFHSEVLGKRISRGKRMTFYYVEVAPWGHHYDKEDIRVAKVQYDELEVGDRVNIDLKAGLFGIPWYYIESK